MIKELQGLTDDEMIEALMFDIRYQYALHTTSFNEQPLSDRTLSRFRERCTTYETQTGIDLIKDCIIKLSAQLAIVMGISPTVKRMDSLMIASNIKKLSRFELLYTCVANMVKFLHRQNEVIPNGMEHYIEKDDRNKIMYHLRSQDISERFNMVLSDATHLIEQYKGYDNESSDYQLLIRVLHEQAVQLDDGTWALKEKSDPSMHSHMLQNSAEPEATYRTKAAKQYRGYAANLTEDVSETGSIIRDYQYDTNTKSDSQFIKEALETMETQPEGTTLVVDGAYGGLANAELAAKHNVDLVTTNFQGRKPRDILADFQFNEDGSKLITCPNGQKPLPNKYSRSTEQCRATFNRSICKQCPYKDECKPKFYKTKTAVMVSIKGNYNAKQLRQMKTE